MNADVLGDNPAEKLDPIVNTLDSISGFINEDNLYGRDIESPESYEGFESSVDTLIQQLEELNIDTSSNEALMLLDSLKLADENNTLVKTDGGSLDEKSRDENILKRLEKRLARVESRTGVNPKLNQARQRNIQGKIDEVKEDLDANAYLDVIDRLLGQ